MNRATEISGKLYEAGLSISALANQQNEASEEIAHKSSSVLEEATGTAKNVEESARLIQALANDVRFQMNKMSELEDGGKCGRSR